MTANTISIRQRGRSLTQSRLLRYLARRLALYLLTLWGSITLAFLVFHFMPGDPLDVFLGEMLRTYGNTEGAAGIIEFYRRAFGLDKPLYMQYLLYLRNLTFGGFDLGPSLMAFPVRARDMILERIPWTLALLTSSMLISWLLGTALGTLLGWFRRHRLTTVATGIATLLQATPTYFVALALIIYFAYVLRILPARGPYDSHLQPAWTWEFISSLLTHAILPMLSMVLVWAASWTMGMRSLLISILGEDYLIHARAKGLSPFTVLKDYAFRNALLPQVSGLAISLGNTLGGAYIIEIFFVYPGVGQQFLAAMGRRDYNVLQATVLFSIFAVLTLGLIVDLTLPLLDPRIRTGHD